MCASGRPARFRPRVARPHEGTDFYLIDTHVWLWMNGAPERLGGSTRDVLSDAGTEIYFSAASGWEIAIKTALGKLELPAPPF
jgi:PIN domain nuclease of toxin-antitoxin system